MAWTLNPDVKTKAGRIIEVINTKRRKFSRAARTYFAVWTENEAGDQEECLLFTKKEIERARDRAQKNLEDIPEKGWITNLFD